MDSAMAELIPDHRKNVLPDPDVLGDPSVLAVDGADILNPSVAD